MKLKAEDIKIIARNTQVKAKVIEKFGSLESFAKTIGMTPKSVNQYFKQSAEYTAHFRGHLSIHLGDYYSLWKPEKQQLEEYVDILTRDIFSYTEEKDKAVLKKALDLSKKYDIIKCVAKSYRNLGMYSLNIGKHDFSEDYYTAAMDYAKEANDLDIICMITTEMLRLYTCTLEYREGDRLSRKFEQRYPVEKVSMYRRFWYYYSAGSLFIYDKSYPYAKPYLDKAEACAQTDYQKLKIYNLLGMYYKKNAGYKKALKYYNDSMCLCEGERDKAIYYNNLASLYYILGKRELAEENIHQAMNYINIVNNSDRISIYGTYASIYKTEESIFKLLEIIETKFEGAFIPMVLEDLNIAIDNISDKVMVINTIDKIIIRNEHNIKFKHELYSLIGAIVHRRGVN